MRPAALLLALLSLAAVRVEAQVPLVDSPLARKVTIHVRDVALRDALDRIAALAGIRLSYSGDNLPLDRRVSVRHDSSAVEAVLGELLRAHAVQPVVVASDHVVLTPRDPSARDTVSHAIPVLDRVVVTGNFFGASERPLPIALDVIRGRQIERRGDNAGDLSKVLSGAVPGVWLWEHTPTSMLARYASIRGASSFGLSFPKVYIDGIEVANPLLLTQITSELVERIEVIRGPQGAALYGSDAISGVVNVVSRHEGASAANGRMTLRSSLGYSASAYTVDAVPVQEHALTLRGGSNVRSAGITIGGATSGQYVPQAYSRELRAVGDARVIAPTTTLTLNARFHGKNAGVPVSPLLSTDSLDEIDADADPQRLRLYSLGSTVLVAPTDRLMYSLTTGLDGYSLANVSIEQSPIPSVADSVLRNASGSATRGTVRASAVATVGSAERVGATFTVAGEHSLLYDRTDPERTVGGSSSDVLENADWSSNSGISTQANLAIADAVYVNAGVRRERLGRIGGGSQFATLPMLGAALVRSTGDVTWKLRSAYGKGIRGARAVQLAPREPRRAIPNPDLGPEQQAGVEAGADMFVGRWLALHVTRFDQLASGLIQTVTISDPSGGSGGPGGGRQRTWFQLQNVGEISNRGWETQASVYAGPASLSGAFAFVDSRVRRLALGYTGDLRPGDRMLAVPARTASGTAALDFDRFSISSTLSRASDWINYDRLAIAAHLLANDGDAAELTGDKLRRFWVSYPGATRLRGSAAFAVRRGLTLSITGENLLNHQRGEPDSITIVPGRTLILGLKARF